MISLLGLMETAIGSACGALGGAYCLWVINRKKEHEKTLSDINYVLAVLIAHMHSLLNFKKQHALPFCEEMDRLIDVLDNDPAQAKNQNKEIAVEAHKIFISVVEADYNIEGLLEKLAPHTAADTKAILLAMKVMEALSCVKDITLMRNQMIVGVENMAVPTEKKLSYVLGKISVNGKTDTRFVDATRGLLSNVDISLHFIDLLIPRVQNIGRQILPASYAKRIADKDFAQSLEMLIPPKDFIDGWMDG